MNFKIFVSFRYKSIAACIYIDELSREFSFFLCMLTRLTYVTLRLLKVTAVRGGARVDVLT